MIQTYDSILKALQLYVDIDPETVWVRGVAVESYETERDSMTNETVYRVLGRERGAGKKVVFAVKESKIKPYLK